MMSGSVPGLKGKTVEISLISRDRDIHIRAYNTFYNTDFYFFFKKSSDLSGEYSLRKGIYFGSERENSRGNEMKNR